MLNRTIRATIIGVVNDDSNSKRSDK